MRAADKHLAAIDAFIASREGGVPAFADRLVGLRGKWLFVKARVSSEAKQKYAAYMNDEFQRLVFKPEELAEVVNKAVASYLAELAGLENDLLVKLRADLSDADTDLQEVIPATQSNDAFKARFDQAAAQLKEIVSRDLQLDVVREVASFLAADIAAQVGLRVMTAVAAKLGVSSGILATGAASTVATFGVGLAACIAFDYLFDWGLKLVGKDAKTRVVKRIQETLAGVVDTIKNGTPEAHRQWKRLTELAENDTDSAVREKAAKEAAAIAKSGSLGLRRELIHLNAVRSAIRKQAIERILQSN